MTMYVNYNELGECIMFTPHVNMMNAKGQSVRIFNNNDSIKNQKKEETHDCPICFETIEKNNCIMTECGHAFHASCLMRHTAVNGYSCPYCRTDMVDKEVFNSDDDETIYDDDDETIYDDDDDEESIDSLRFDGGRHRRNHVEVLTNEINMQNFRWLFQRANNEETEEDVDDTVTTMTRLIAMDREAEIIDQENKDQMDKVMELVKKTNITFQDIVYAFLVQYIPDYKYNVHAERHYYKCSNILDRVAHEAMTT